MKKTQASKTTAAKLGKNTNQAASFKERVSSVLWIRGIETGDTVSGPGFVNGRLCNVRVRADAPAVEAKEITVADAAKVMRDGLAVEERFGFGYESTDSGLAKWFAQVATVAA